MRWLIQLSRLWEQAILKGKYQNFTEADKTNLEAAGYDGGFYDMYDAVKEYCDFLDAGGYFTYGK